MNNSYYLARLYKSFLCVNGPTFTLAGFVLTILSWFIIPETHTTPTRIYIVSVIIFCILLAVFIHSSISEYSSNKSILPQVEYAKDPPLLGIYKNSVALLLLESSLLFKFDSFVSVYHIESEIEDLIGFGKIINIQENDKIQVLVFSDMGYKDLWDRIKNSNKTTLKNVFVKPNIPSHFNNKVSE